MQTNSYEQTKRGAFYAIAAYGAWGLFPAFWKLFHALPHSEILAHRIVWSTVFFALLLRYQFGGGFSGELRKALHHWRALLLSSALISTNWFVYIYAVNSGQVLESSLGYFIAPLVNVVLGLTFLKEKLRRAQWLAVGFATLGVIQLTLQNGSVPFLALSLALSFGLYGLVRKKTPVAPLGASSTESLILLLPAAAFLLASHFILDKPPASLFTWNLIALLVLSGAVTGLPLLWFAEAGKRLPLSSLGFFQYIAPSLQFLLAVFAYHETFTAVHARSFACIWIALIIYATDMAVTSRKQYRYARLSACKPT